MCGLDARPVTRFPNDFSVAGHWGASPDDRCEEWELVKRDGRLFVVPTIKEAAPCR
jgi:ribosomal protein L36